MRRGQEHRELRIFGAVVVDLKALDAELVVEVLVIALVVETDFLELDVDRLYWEIVFGAN